MKHQTGIQWTHAPGYIGATWNPLRARHRETGAEGWACVKVSPGCVNCYSKVMNEGQRFGKGTGLDYTEPALAQVETYLHEETLIQPLRWQKPRGVFVCSMTDLFGEWVTDEEIDRIFAVMALSPQHIFMVLTKRPERMRAYFAPGQYRDVRVGDAAKRLNPATTLRPEMMPWPLPNVWLGVTVEDQARADERVPLLLDTPAAVRFLSCEPLLSGLDLADYAPGADSAARLLYGGIDWVIVGGESGKGARWFDVAWARSLRDQCAAAGVPFFMKQLGGNVRGDYPSGRVPRRWIMPDGDEWSPPVIGSRVAEMRGAAVGYRPRHPHGGNIEEWPEDLRVRQWPSVAGAAVES